MSATRFSTTIDGQYVYNFYDSRVASCMPLGYIKETSIMRSLYDIDKNGSITAGDVQHIIGLINGTVVGNGEKISGTFNINSAEPKDFISIKSGSTLAVSIGVGGVNAHLVSAENIVCGTQTGAGNFSGVAINGGTGAVSAQSFNNISLEGIKKNIAKFENALEIIENSEIYEYNFKTESDTDKKHIGFVIGKKYKTPEQVKSNDRNAIEGYSMKSINWRATQQILEIVKNLEKRIIVLEEK